MKYYRCKCGKKTAWSTRGVQDCEGCKECGTTLAERTKKQKPVADHAAVVYYRQTDGSPYLVCSKCSSTALGYSPEEEADVIKNLQLIDKVLNGEQYKPEPMDKAWCMCTELAGVYRDGQSTCSKCGGKDAYGGSKDRPPEKQKKLEDES